MNRITVALSLLATAFSSPSHAAGKTYAQQLVDQTISAHPEVVVLAMHVKPVKGTENIIIASNIGRIGKVADEDDMRVIDTGKPNLAVNKAGDRFEVELPLQNVSGTQIGALGVVFAYQAGDDKIALQHKAEQIRDALRRRISNLKNLFDAYPADPAVPTDTYAQQLVDKTMDKYPDLLILAMHAAPAGGKDNVIIGSSIGRIGKKADEDDMRVVKTGKPNLEINEDGSRFEVESALKDKSGKIIGAVGAVFAYKAGDDKKALQARGERIRDELSQSIPSAESLFERAK